MNATDRQISAVLTEREIEYPFGILSYSRAYAILKRHAGQPDRAVEALVKWRDQGDLSLHTQTFRANAFPNLEWCATTVLPRILRVNRHLDGDRQSTGRLLQIAGQPFTGGFHASVHWDDDSERFLYFLGPGWTRKRIRNMLTLLQMKAVSVYRRFPQSVVIADISRQELIELQDLDPTDRDLATETAKWLIDYMRRRRAG